MYCAIVRSSAPFISTIQSSQSDIAAQAVASAQSSLETNAIFPSPMLLRMMPFVFSTASTNVETIASAALFIASLLLSELYYLLFNCRRLNSVSYIFIVKQLPSPVISYIIHLYRLFSSKITKGVFYNEIYEHFCHP